jgi:hypothetical protein
LTPALKKKITRDWLEFFTGLGVKKPMIFGRRVGPLLISIGLQPKFGSEYYEPGFSVHNLSREIDFLTANLDEPLRTIRTNAPDTLKVMFHDRNYREAAERMRAQALLPLEGSVPLKTVIHVYKTYVAKHRYPELIDQLEDPAMIAVWAGEPELAQQALEWGYETLETWSEPVQKGQGGVDAWRAKMEQIIANPEKLRAITRQEVEKHKLSHLPYEDFPDARYKEKESR